MDVKQKTVERVDRSCFMEWDDISHAMADLLELEGQEIVISAEGLSIILKGYKRHIARKALEQQALMLQDNGFVPVAQRGIFRRIGELEEALDFWAAQGEPENGVG